MYAIVEIAGQQFKAEKGRKLYVHRLADIQEGGSVSFDQVLLVDNDGKVKVGTPTVKNTTVEATVIKHLKDDKVLVFKKKRRKGYQKLNGHRQCLTQIEIKGIKEKSSTTAANTAKVAETANTETATQAE